MDTYKDMAEEFCELEGLGHSPGDAWKMMELSRLDRIADALEGIKSGLSEISVSLDSLEKDLDGCISISGKGRFLCITGNISTY